MAFAPVGPWFFAKEVADLGGGYASATVTDAGPLSTVAPTQLVLVDLSRQAREAPDVYPADAIVARDLDGAWHPEPGWAIVTEDAAGWLVESSRTYEAGTVVMLVDGAAVALDGTSYVVDEAQIVAVFEPD